MVAALCRAAGIPEQQVFTRARRLYTVPRILSVPAAPRRRTVRTSIPRRGSFKTEGRTRRWEKKDEIARGTADSKLSALVAAFASACARGRFDLTKSNYPVRLTVAVCAAAEGLWLRRDSSTPINYSCFGRLPRSPDASSGTRFSGSPEDAGMLQECRLNLKLSHRPSRDTTMR